MKQELQRLLEITAGCRPDMHEPDEQDVTARVLGFTLDNAMGNRIDENALIQGWQELVVILTRTYGNGVTSYEAINLATLVALARKAVL